MNLYILWMAYQIFAFGEKDYKCFYLTDISKLHLLLICGNKRLFLNMLSINFTWGQITYSKWMSNSYWPQYKICVRITKLGWSVVGCSDQLAFSWEELNFVQEILSLCHPYSDCQVLISYRSKCWSFAKCYYPQPCLTEVGGRAEVIFKYFKYWKFQF